MSARTDEVAVDVPFEAQLVDDARMRGASRRGRPVSVHYAIVAPSDAELR